MSREKSSLSVRLGPTGGSVPSGPSGLRAGVYVSPCAGWVRGACLWVSGTREAGEPSCSWHAFLHSCRQGLTLTFVGPKIEARPSMQPHKAPWQPHAVTGLVRPRPSRGYTGGLPEGRGVGTEGFPGHCQPEGSCFSLNFMARRYRQASLPLREGHIPNSGPPLPLCPLLRASNGNPGPILPQSNLTPLRHAAMEPRKARP